ncbi:hypothetical protein ABEB36_013683 [Hypothenemus hampei]|uniref:Uncharacterized protein n=1 Tax=Hypothenemus hampei TaxID=57062 RepID=A0ABD1E596_HYPHA
MRAIITTDTLVTQLTSYLHSLCLTLQEVRDTYEKTQDQKKKYADQARRACEFRAGDKVLIDFHMLSNSGKQFTSKFSPKRDGPYVIQKMVTPTTCLISSLEDLEKTMGKYHVSALTPYCGDSHEYPPPIHPLKRRGRPPKEKPTALSADSSSPEDPPIVRPPVREEARPGLRRGLRQKKSPVRYE